MIKIKWFQAGIFYFFVFLIACLIYVFPPVYYLSLFGFSASIVTLFYTAFMVSLIITFYLRTKVTFKPLKLLVYVGMVLGFYGFFLALLGMFLQQFVPVYYVIVGFPILLVSIILYGFFNATKLVPIFINIKSKKVNKPYHFAFISDVHLGSQSTTHLIKILDLIKQQPVDALLIGGDLIDSCSFNIDDLNVLKKLPIPIYFVTGNHEFYLKDSENLIAQLNNYNINNIDFKHVIHKHIRLIGIGDNAKKSEKINFLKRLPSSNLFTILIIHKPSLWPDISSYCDLMLSGHTHAGQLFPFQWFVKLQFPFYYGYRLVNELHGYVSSGAGCWGPNVRIGSNNEVVFIKIE